MDIFIAILVGYWFGVAIDLYILDVEIGHTEPIHTYITEPARTIARAARLAWKAVKE